MALYAQLRAVYRYLETRALPWTARRPNQIRLHTAWVILISFFPPLSRRCIACQHGHASRLQPACNQKQTGKHTCRPLNQKSHHRSERLDRHKEPENFTQGDPGYFAHAMPLPDPCAWVGIVILLAGLAVLIRWVWAW